VTPHFESGASRPSTNVAYAGLFWARPEFKFSIWEWDDLHFIDNRGRGGFGKHKLIVSKLIVSLK